jgi:ligand-binding SRPBCC domain-containing protein
MQRLAGPLPDARLRLRAGTLRHDTQSIPPEILLIFFLLRILLSGRRCNPSLRVFETCGRKSIARRFEAVTAIQTTPEEAGRLRQGWKDGVATLQSRLFLPRPLETVFPFFADPGNLESITPPWLRFKILTPRPISMKQGQIIEYRLRLHGVPMRWESEITVWEPPHRFVDEQLRGPYRKWIHEHSFAERGGGSEVCDFVRYAVPGGRLTDYVCVRRDVRRIFEYRITKLREIFG